MVDRLAHSAQEYGVSLGDRPSHADARHPVGRQEGGERGGVPTPVLLDRSSYRP